MKNSDPIDAQMAILATGHKCRSFSDAPTSVLPERARVLTELRHYLPGDLYEEAYVYHTPTESFMVTTPPYFVLELMVDEWYLVDTQGYNYCRRICRVVPFRED